MSRDKEAPGIRMPQPISLSDANRFEFVRLASLRTAQLMRGCTARVPASLKFTTTAQREVAARHICSLPHTARAMFDDPAKGTPRVDHPDPHGASAGVAGRSA
jgi:hypothetical protein